MADHEPDPGPLPVCPSLLISNSVGRCVRYAEVLFQKLEGEDAGESPAVKSGAYLWILIIHLFSVTSFSG